MSGSAKSGIVTDLTQGPVPSLLLRFASPLILANLLQAIYNLVDMVIVGQFVGKTGLAGVSIGTDIIHFYTFICVGFATAGQIMVSQCIGKKDYDGVRRTIGTVFSFTLALAVVIGIVGALALDPLLRWMNTPAEAYDDAYGYNFVCLMGMFFMGGYNVVSAILRGMGDSKHPLLFIGIAALLNLLLDLLFVAVFHMGTRGAALATVIGEGVSFVVSIVFLYRRREHFYFDFRPRSFRPDRQSLKNLVKLGIPTALQSCAVSLSIIFVNSYINSYGVVASAVTGVGTKLMMLIFTLSNALSSAASSMVGQSLGAGKAERVPKILGSTMFICFIICTVCSAVMLLFPKQIFSLFNRDPEVLALAPSYALAFIINAYGSATRAPVTALVSGMGNALLGFILGILDGVVVRVGLSLLLGLTCGMGIQGFWLGGAIAGFTFFSVGAPYYFSGRWKKHRLFVDT